MILMMLLIFTGCSGKGTLSEITIDDAKISKFAEIATNLMEQPEIWRFRKDYLSMFGNETQAPYITHAIEVHTDKKSAKTATHLYIIRVIADALDKSSSYIYDFFTIVYDCDTGKAYSNMVEPYNHGVGEQTEYSKEYYIASAINLGILQSSLPENWNVFNFEEKHAAFDAKQLEVLNEQFHPAGWEYREEVIIEMNDNGEANQEASYETIDDSGMIQIPEISNQEMSKTAADAISIGFKNHKFAQNELIDDTIISAKEYSVVCDGMDTPIRLMYVWMNGNVENNEYAGQIVINLDTGDILFASDFDENKINFEAIDIYYFYWLGRTAFDGSGYIMNDSETLVSLSDELVNEIQKMIYKS